MRAVRFVLLLPLVGCGSDVSPSVDMGAADTGKATPSHDAGTATAVRDAGKPAPPDAGPPVRFSEIYEELFPVRTNARCNFCHSMPASDKSNGNLGMGDDKDAAYAALIDQTSSSSHCNGMPLLTPGDPDRSLFLLKFSEPAPCGARMPLGGKELTSAQLARLRSWIAAGANND